MGHFQSRPIKRRPVPVVQCPESSFIAIGQLNKQFIYMSIVGHFTSLPAGSMINVARN
jgi:hypothetical protein